MEHPMRPSAWRSVFVMLFLSLFNLMVCAQTAQGGSGSNSTTTTKKTSINTTTNDNTGASTWYTSPWVWVVGAAAFILLLVALLSNRGRDMVTRDTVITKTVERDESNGA